jgi:hypothetical protein
LNGLAVFVVPIDTNHSFAINDRHWSYGRADPLIMIELIGRNEDHSPSRHESLKRLRATIGIGDSPLQIVSATASSTLIDLDDTATIFFSPLGSWDDHFEQSRR